MLTFKSKYPITFRTSPSESYLTMCSKISHRNQYGAILVEYNAELGFVPVGLALPLHSRVVITAMGASLELIMLRWDLWHSNFVGYTVE